MLNKAAVAIEERRAGVMERSEIDFEWRRRCSFEDVILIWTGKSLSTARYEESYATSTHVMLWMLFITLYASAWIAWLHQNG
jgi:hypothetical protein